MGLSRCRSAFALYGKQLFFLSNIMWDWKTMQDMGLKYISVTGNGKCRLLSSKLGLTDFGDKSELTADRYSYDIAGDHKEVNR